ncbi:PH domain-containing protein [Nocardiopsis algeriensis]|uniref:Putative membrane protein n=1 Tax=Nocardiopsis algeriensis TaxID=1478215 RepID=A0A841IMA2_9ACTN|nr:PH domain-containing protein [Nocardiopsis algeriensis]MBB6119867.1 putative membrane protein [Nocardiopsis algeriensis]
MTAHTDDGTPAVQSPAPLGDWQGLSTLSVWANTAAGGVPTMVTAVIGTVALIAAGQGAWALAPVPAGLALTALMTWIELVRLRATRYRVTSERMEMRSGILATAHRSIPRDRVRSVDVAAPIHARLFGLCAVTVGTGEAVGSGSDQLQLQFVTAEQGERLRRELLYRRPAASGGAAGATPEDRAGGAAEAGEEVEVELARLDPRWFAYAPATTATAGIGIGAIATLLGANAQSEGRMWLWLSERAGLPDSAEIASYVMARLLLVVPTFLAGLLLSGVVVLLAVAVETWWNYRLTRSADGTVRLRRGLLTSVSLSVEGRRLNGVVLHEPFVLRTAGGADVRAVATGLSAGDDRRTSAKSRLSPAMPRARALELSADLTRTRNSPLEVSLAAHPRAALRRRFTRAGIVTVLGAVAAAGAAWLHTLANEAFWEAVYRIEERLSPVPVAARSVAAAPLWVWAVAAVLLGAAALWYAVGSYRGLGHGLHPRYLVVRKGMASRDTVALERSAVIGWRITRSPLQRRAGLAHVSATTAAGEGVYTAADVGLGQGLAWAHEAVPGLLSPFLVRVGPSEEEPRPT